eukprot:tig00020892_g14938.t1
MDDFNKVLNSFRCVVPDGLMVFIHEAFLTKPTAKPDRGSDVLPQGKKVFDADARPTYPDAASTIVGGLATTRRGGAIRHPVGARAGAGRCADRRAADGAAAARPGATRARPLAEAAAGRVTSGAAGTAVATAEATVTVAATAAQGYDPKTMRVTVSDGKVKVERIAESAPPDKPRRLRLPPGP